MREQRRTVTAMRENGFSADEVAAELNDYRQTLKEYGRFSKAVGQKIRPDRVYADGLGSMETSGCYTAYSDRTKAEYATPQSKTPTQDADSETLSNAPLMTETPTAVAQLNENHAEGKEKTVEILPNDSIIAIMGDKGISIPREKFTSYALNPRKALDKVKAFEQALGNNLSNADALINDIEQQLKYFSAKSMPANRYGTKYSVELLLTGLNGKQAYVTTAWIRYYQNGEVKLVTAYVSKRHKTCAVATAV